jgi:NAD(P)-dependent dehydrogenase (short-subunit alcohol dehydrogenase family)
MTDSEDGPGSGGAGAVLASLFGTRGQVALVTGGASGLGYAFAEILAACGAIVVVADWNAERLEKAAASSGTPVRAAPPEAEARWKAVIPLGRMGDPAEIRGLALLLASNASSFMTGGVYPIDGGALLQGPSLPDPPK